MMLDVGHEQLESLGSSPAMRELRASIVAVTLAGRDIVLCGEPGTGRRWVARAIHGMGGHEPSSWIETDARQIAPSDIDALVRAARCGTLVFRELAAAQDGVRAAIDAAARARPYGAATRLVATVGDLAAASGSLGEGAVFLRLPPLRERAREDLMAVLDSVHRTLRADMGVTPSLLDAAARP